MKKLAGLVVAIACACACALCLSLAGCGGVDKSGYLGNWSLESGTDSTLDADSIALMKTLGLEVFLTLNEDGTGTMNMFGQKLDASWEAESSTEGKVTIDQNESKLTLADQKLTLTDAEGKTLTFAKYEGEIPSTTAATVPSAASSASASAASASAASAGAEPAGATATDSDDESTTEQDSTATATQTSDSEEDTESYYTDESTDESGTDDGVYYEEEYTEGEGDGEYYEETDDVDVYYESEEA